MRCSSCFWNDPDRTTGLFHVLQQAGLYEVRGLYAKAIADRESLEARAARAEAEKAAAETNWQRAKAQVGAELMLITA